jgi:hypothetical protein
MKEFLMQVRHAIRLDNTDTANPRHMFEALNLSGGKDVAPDDHPGLRAFRVISANDFSMADVQTAISYLEERRVALYAQADEILADRGSSAFDRNRSAVLAEGIRASADHALRLAHKFADDLGDDLGANP